MTRDGIDWLINHYEKCIQNRVKDKSDNKKKTIKLYKKIIADLKMRKPD